MRAIYSLLLVLGLSAACSKQPEREVWAVVLSIAPHENPKWSPDEVVITARSPDGAAGSKAVLIARLKCRVGDTVHGHARGLALTLDDHACER